MITQNFIIRVPRTNKWSLDSIVEIYINGTDAYVTKRGRVIGIQLPDDSVTEREITIRIETPKEPGPDW